MKNSYLRARWPRKPAFRTRRVLVEPELEVLPGAWGIGRIAEVARVAYPTSSVVLVDEALALAAPARAFGEWRGALGLPDLAEKARTLLPETAGGRAAADTDAGPGA